MSAVGHGHPRAVTVQFAAAAAAAARAVLLVL